MFTRKKISIYEILKTVIVSLNVWNLQIRLRTAVDVSKDTGKNPPAVRQHGRIDFIIIIFTSFRIILPASVIGKVVHQPVYVATPTFVLSSINPWQLYVKKTMWIKLPITVNIKVRRVVIGTSVYIQNEAMVMFYI